MNLFLTRNSVENIICQQNQCDNAVHVLLPYWLIDYLFSLMDSFLLFIYDEWSTFFTKIVYYLGLLLPRHYIRCFLFTPMLSIYGGTRLRKILILIILGDLDDFRISSLDHIDISCWRLYG